GHQPWPRLALGDGGGQPRERRPRTTGADQTMTAVLDDLRSDHGQLPDLMPQRLGVRAHQPLTTTAAVRRLEFLDVGALLRRQQGAFVFAVAGLASALAPTPLVVPLRLSVRVLAAGRDRGIA